MPRYLVERIFAGGFPAESDDPGYAGVCNVNAELSVTWLESYHADDTHRGVCVCEAPSPEAIRRAANRYRWPVDAITKITVIVPHRPQDPAAPEGLGARSAPTV
jgi:Protein of unknown function (DUF4242)